MHIGEGSITSRNSFSVCGARYKTRPGLTYHYNHSHKDRDKSIPVGGYPPGGGPVPSGGYPQSAGGLPYQAMGGGGQSNSGHPLPMSHVTHMDDNAMAPGCGPEEMSKTSGTGSAECSPMSTPDHSMDGSSQGDLKSGKEKAEKGTRINNHTLKNAINNNNTFSYPPQNPTNLLKYYARLLLIGCCTQL